MENVGGKKQAMLLLWERGVAGTQKRDDEEDNYCINRTAIVITAVTCC